MLNSNLITFYHRKKNLEEFKDRFQKILIKDCKVFPFKSISSTDQEPFVPIVNNMLTKTKELHQLKHQLQQLLLNKYEGLRLSKKLEDWPTLTFKDFLKELTKQKIKLTIPEEAEWMKYFEEQKAIASGIQEQISNTDKEIDKMVYEMYDLSEEEIKIVEGN